MRVIKNTLQIVRCFFEFSVLKERLLFFLWEYIDECSDDQFSSKILYFLGLELDHSTHESKESIVFTLSHVFSRMKLGTTLTNDDVTYFCELSSENLDTETLGNRITAEGGGSACFFVCHTRKTYKLLYDLIYCRS